MIPKRKKKKTWMIDVMMQCKERWKKNKSVDEIWDIWVFIYPDVIQGFFRSI